MSAIDTKPTAAILTLGCKLNMADSEAMARRFAGAGWRVVQQADGADAVIVNSCSVTHAADQKSLQLVRRARRMAPEATIALTGCIVETAPKELIDAQGGDLVYRQVDQTALADRLIATRAAVIDAGTPPKKPSLKTRAFISAQEGCNDVCAFCIIPRTRGRERSKPIEAVVGEAQAREAEGAQELVITGTQLGAYGRDHSERALMGLIATLLRETSVPRIRMSSVQPQDLSPALIDLWQDPRLCRHFHLALQSGSDGVLRRMRRRYTLDDYLRAVVELRAAIPNVAITTDVIAGFPGETDAEFEETYAFCHEMGFAAMHVFPYSQRAGTTAEKLPSPVEEGVKKERVRRLITLGETMGAAYRRRFISTETSVLFETRREDDAAPAGTTATVAPTGRQVWDGLTDTYLRVRASSIEDLANRYRRVRITHERDEILIAEVIQF